MGTIRIVFTVGELINYYLILGKDSVLFGALLGFMGASANVMTLDREAGYAMLLMSLAIWSLVWALGLLNYVMRLIRYSAPWV